LKKSLELEEDSKINKDCGKNEEDEINDRKRFLLYTCKDKSVIKDGRISKETTARGTKLSFESTSK